MLPPDRWHLVAQYVTGDASDAEQKEIRSWIDGSPSRQALVKQVQAIYNAGGEEAVEQIDVDAAWKRVTGRLSRPSTVARPSRRTDRRPTVPTRGRRHVGLAPVAVDCSPTLPANGVGEQSTVESHGGTVVRLNAGSTLPYPSAFDDEERVTELDGEAYVEAASSGERVTRCGIDLATHLSWLEGRLFFEDDTPLADPSLEYHPVTATFDKRDTIDNVIDVLARALDLHVDQTEEVITLSEVSSC